MSKYVPPHLRNKQSEASSVPPPRAVNVSESFQGRGTQPKEIRHSVAEQQKSNRAVSDSAAQDAERERHPDMSSLETTTLTTFYTENSEIFRKWAHARNEGYNNKFIAHFFEKKESVKESTNHKRGGAFEGADIKPIFTQFFKYALDVDNGLAYSERCKDIAITTGKCWFLDFGFAPGGMADLLLESHPSIKGVGVTLDPNLGGNVYLPSLNNNERFFPYVDDVIEMARRDLDLKIACNLPDDFDGFDLVIPGITIHQEWHGENMNELKDLLHFAQLFFALKYLKPGGVIMMRMHMSVRLVDCHMLAMLLSMFSIESFTGLEIGKQRIQERKDAQPKEEIAQVTQGMSKLEMMHSKLNPKKVIKSHYAWNNLEKTAVATKPFSTFSMRKTYWVCYHGFQVTPELRRNKLDKLSQVLKADLFAYGYNTEKQCFNHPVLMDEPIEELLQKYGKKMIAVLEDVWEKQVIALEGFMKGLTDKYCRDGSSCRKRHCNMAHSPHDMIPEVADALEKVDVRANPRLNQLGFI